jgi:hypothetical protein
MMNNVMHLTIKWITQQITDLDRMIDHCITSAIIINTKIKITDKTNNYFRYIDLKFDFSKQISSFILVPICSILDTI